jgi:scyllo-inositol 2-dehydrogenase (NADP+)|nr:Gfo/Idh/MocA family oxidoreductase [uncultured Schaedlerella sp.]
MLKAGIIGFGYMGHFHYNKILEFPERIRAAAVYDVEESARAEAAEKGMRAYDTLEAFLKEEMDLVIIATPNQWHARYAIAAMRSGKHVVLEKPAVMTVKEMEEVIDCEKETGRLLTIHHQRRHDMDFQVVSQIVKSGEIGNVTTIESRVMGERGVCFGWRADPEYGGGMLYDWGVHLIDQLLQLLDGQKVHSVCARLMSILTPAVDDYFELSMEFDRNVCARVVVTTFALEKLPRWFVFGDRGTLELQDFSGTVGSAKKIRQEIQGYESVLGRKNLGPSRTMAPLSPEYLERIKLPEPAEESMKYWKNLLDSLENGKAPEVKSEEILRVMKVVESAFQSSREKQVVRTEI